jgi:hypothetical protein
VNGRTQERREQVKQWGKPLVVSLTRHGKVKWKAYVPREPKAPEFTVWQDAIDFALEYWDQFDV